MKSDILDASFFLQCPVCKDGNVNCSLRQILDQAEFSCSSCSGTFVGIGNPNWFDLLEPNELTPFYNFMYRGQPLPESASEDLAVLLLKHPEYASLFPEKDVPALTLVLMAVCAPEKKLTDESWEKIKNYVLHTDSVFPASFLDDLEENKKALYVTSPFASAKKENKISNSDFYRISRYFQWNSFLTISAMPRSEYLSILPDFPELLNSEEQTPLTSEEALQILQNKPELYPLLKKIFQTKEDRVKLFLSGNEALLAQIRPTLSDLICGHSFGQESFHRAVSQFRLALLQTVVWGLFFVLFFRFSPYISSYETKLLTGAAAGTCVLFLLMQYTDYRFYGHFASGVMLVITGILLPLPILLFLWTTGLFLKATSLCLIALLLIVLLHVIRACFYSFGASRRKRFDINSKPRGAVIVFCIFLPELLAVVLCCAPLFSASMPEVSTRVSDIRSFAEEKIKNLTVKEEEKTVSLPEENIDRIAELEPGDETGDPELSGEKARRILAEVRGTLQNPPAVEKTVSLSNQEKAKNLIQEKKYSEALRFAVNCDLNDAENQFLLGEIFASSEFRERNLALKYYYRAAKQRHAGAMLRIGELKMDGKWLKQDPEGAIKWLTRSAELGNAVAQVRLTIACRSGFGCPKDPVKSFKWCEKAAMQKYDVAQRLLGAFYYDGYGVEQDYKKAFYWTMEAAKKNNADAMFLLSRMYASGQGVKRDITAAELWKNRAVNSGSVEAEHGERMFEP